MRTLTRVFVVLALLYLEFILFNHVQALRSKEDADNTLVLVLFISIIFVAIIIGTIFATSVIPAIGETIGGWFFSPGAEEEKGPYVDALVKVAHGDYEGAIEEYKGVFENNPEDTHAASEIVHLYCDKLGNADAAEQFLADALQTEWPPEQAAFFASRLADVYWNYKHDAVSARHILTQIAETMPGTKHAANAIHRLQELDRAVADEEAGIRLHTKPAPPHGKAG